MLKKYVKEGEPVKKGELLLEFDDADLRQEIAREKAQMLAARHEYEKAQKEVGIQKQLFSYGAVPKKTSRTRSEALARGRAALTAAQASVAEKAKDLDKTKVYSPMDGFLISEDTIKHDPTAALDKDMFTVGTLDAFRAVVNLDEEDLSKITWPGGDDQDRGFPRLRAARHRQRRGSEGRPHRVRQDPRHHHDQRPGWGSRSSPTSRWRHV